MCMHTVIFMDYGKQNNMIKKISMDSAKDTDIGGILDWTENHH